MSHIVKIKCQIRDLKALEQAAKHLGLEFVANQTTFKYFAGQNGQCEHALRIPGNTEAFEIGVSRNGDHYELQWDSWAGGHGLTALVSRQGARGRDADRLIQAYATHATLNVYQRQGYRVAQSTDAQGNIVLRASR